LLVWLLFGPAAPLVLRLGAVDVQLPVTIVHGEVLLPLFGTAEMAALINCHLLGHCQLAGSAHPVDLSAGCIGG